MSNIICNRKVSAKLKRRLYSTAKRPAMLYAIETVTVTKRQEEDLEVAELRMLRFAMGVTKMDKIRNNYTRVNASVGRNGKKLKKWRLW